MELTFVDGGTLRFSAEIGGLMSPPATEVAGWAWFNCSREELLAIGQADIQLLMTPGLLELHFRSGGAVLGAAIAAGGGDLTSADGKGTFQAMQGTQK